MCHCRTVRAMVSKSRLRPLSIHILFTCFDLLSVIFGSYYSSPSLKSISSSHDTVNVLDISELPKFYFLFTFPSSCYLYPFPSPLISISLELSSLLFLQHFFFLKFATISHITLAVYITPIFLVNSTPTSLPETADHIHDSAIFGSVSLSNWAFVSKSICLQRLMKVSGVPRLRIFRVAAQCSMLEFVDRCLLYRERA